MFDTTADRPIAGIGGLLTGTLMGGAMYIDIIRSTTTSDLQVLSVFTILGMAVYVILLGKSGDYTRWQYGFFDGIVFAPWFASSVVAALLLANHPALDTTTRHALAVFLVLDLLVGLPILVVMVRDLTARNNHMSVVDNTDENG